MDANRFDDLTRSLTTQPSRRRVVRGIAAAALAQATLLGPGSSTEAARKRRRNKNRIKTNKYGCVDVGEKCYGKDGKCCSGICAGEGNRSKCAAHNEGGCTRDDSSCPEPSLAGLVASATGPPARPDSAPRAACVTAIRARKTRTASQSSESARPASSASLTPRIRASTSTAAKAPPAFLLHRSRELNGEARRPSVESLGQGGSRPA